MRPRWRPQYDEQRGHFWAVRVEDAPIAQLTFTVRNAFGSYRLINNLSKLDTLLGRKRPRNDA